MKLTVVLLSGKQGSGKTTTQDALIAALMKREKTLALKMNFADEIYLIHNFALNRLSEHGFQVPQKDGKLLQLLGTEWGRTTHGQDVWVQVIKSRINRFIEMNTDRDGHLVVVIGDCRFKNEFDAFPDALTVRLYANKSTRVERCSAWRDNDQHQSEIDLDQYSADERFKLSYNTGNLTTDEIIKDLIERI